MKTEVGSDYFSAQHPLGVSYLILSRREIHQNKTSQGPTQSGAHSVLDFCLTPLSLPAPFQPQELCCSSYKPSIWNVLASNIRLPPTPPSGFYLNTSHLLSKAFPHHCHFKLYMRTCVHRCFIS